MGVATRILSHPDLRLLDCLVHREFSCGSIIMTRIFLNSYDFLLNFKKQIFLKKSKLSVFFIMTS